MIVFAGVKHLIGFTGQKKATAGAAPAVTRTLNLSTLRAEPL